MAWRRAHLPSSLSLVLEPLLTRAGGQLQLRVAPREFSRRSLLRSTRDLGKLLAMLCGAGGGELGLAGHG
jgi:hypothetical protein